MRKIYIYIDDKTKQLIAVKTDESATVKEIVLEVDDADLSGFYITEKIKEIIQKEVS
jgi:hypothetical protein